MPLDVFEAHEDAEEPGEISHLRDTDAGWELNVKRLRAGGIPPGHARKNPLLRHVFGAMPLCGKNRNLDPCTCNATENPSPLAQALRECSHQNQLESFCHRGAIMPLPKKKTSKSEETCAVPTTTSPSLTSFTANAAKPACPTASVLVAAEYKGRQYTKGADA